MILAIAVALLAVLLLLDNTGKPLDEVWAVALSAAALVLAVVVIVDGARR